MTTFILFHSALGLRPAVHRFAALLRDAGHETFTPDLFDGEVFDTLEEGIAKRDALGVEELLRRAHAAVDGLPSQAVYAGFSMGAAPAQLLAGTRPNARGAVLMHGALPLEALSIAEWPADVPVQVHHAERDPWVDGRAVEALAERVPSIEVFHYPGSGHLFTDHGSPDHDPVSSARLARRVLGLLGHAGGDEGR
jgi:dienelactone hydrolase